MAKSKSKQGIAGLLPILLGALSIVAAVFFVLPQFSHKRGILDPTDISGFGLAFGFEDPNKIPGRFFVFLPFVFAIIAGAVLLALPFVKSLKKNAKPVYIVAAALALVSVVLLVVAIAGAKSFHYSLTGTGIDKIYYFKDAMESSVDSLKGAFTIWFWLGIVFHALTAAGCCYGFVKSK
jgi:hypothetical protein